MWALAELRIPAALVRNGMAYTGLPGRTVADWAMQSAGDTAEVQW